MSRPDLPEGIDRLNRWAGWLGSWSILVMLAIGAWNVIGRFLGLALGLSLSSNALLEAQWYLFSLAFLLGLGWTLQRDGHVRVDVLHSRWSKRRQQQVELGGTLGLLLPFCLMVLLVSLQPAWQSFLIQEASPDPGGLPRFWVKALIPLGFALLALQGLAAALRLRRSLRR
jgi:TRAP-type mannitol/chloroaromatic compound transport system permease small subunit